MSSLQGQLLIASPHLPDDNFFRSVVLIIQHEPSGALGVVLNRPSDLSVREVWQKLGEGESECTQPVFLGGPVAGPLMVVHTQQAYAESVILPGLFFASEKDMLRSVIEGSAGLLRLFSGYSGWGPGQLEGEMQAGAWLTRRATPGYVFEVPHEELWRRVMDDVGRDLMGGTLKLTEIPDDPSLN